MPYVRVFGIKGECLGLCERGCAVRETSLVRDSGWHALSIAPALPQSTGAQAQCSAQRARDTQNDAIRTRRTLVRYMSTLPTCFCRGVVLRGTFGEDSSEVTFGAARRMAQAGRRALVAHVNKNVPYACRLCERPFCCECECEWE